ncbi:MAG: TadE/TadG family type IV pilus assembly protein [Acidimicrobiia bacterium]
MTTNQSKLRSDRGAALVEMALILPLFVLLVFGMMEAGWAFAQANDIRHGAREGARLAAVDHGDLTTIGREVCDRMDITPAANTTVTLTAVMAVDSNGDPIALGSPGAEGARNAQARIQVSTTSPGLTGVISGFTNLSLNSDIDFRLEQPATGDASWWAAAQGGGTHTCGT